MTPSPIPRAEYEDRWAKVQQACRDADLEGAVVWSRGGATLDTYADVFYLSNHYSQFPLLRDLPPHWVGHSHTAVVLPTGEEPTLIVDLPDWRRDLVVVDDVRFSLNLPRTVGEVLAERGLSRSRLGLVGGNSLLVSPYQSMLSVTPDVEFVFVEDLVERIRVQKSPTELELLREALAIGNAVVGAIMETAVQAGRTEAEAVAAGYAIAASRGAAMYDAAVASGPNSDYYAFGRLPSWTTRSLEQGDMFHVDAYGAVNGYLFDLARSCVVGNSPAPDQVEVLEGVLDAVSAGVTMVRPGVRASEVYKAVQSVLEDRGLIGKGEDGGGSALLESFPSHGHSLGLFWEAPWMAPWDETELRAGMCIAIEAMGGRTQIGSACFEQVVIIHESGPEVLSTTPTRYW